MLFKKNQPPQTNDLPASLKPRQSAFGTTVMFDETPQFKKAKAEQLTEQKQKEIKSEEQEEQAPVQKKQKQQPEKKERKQEEKPKPVPKVESKIKELKQEEPEAPEPKEELKEQEKPEEIKDRIKEIEKQQEMLEKAEQEPKEQKPPSMPRTERIRTIGESPKDKSTIVKKRSIVAMTKGFVENLKNEGNDWLERKGDDNKRPSFEEMKYISYEQEVNWHLQNSWKQNFGCRPWEKVIEGKAVIDFKITLNGDVKDVKLLQSSGYSELDNIILKSVHLAAPFPPLPKHFGKDVYNTGRIIYVNSHRLGF